VSPHSGLSSYGALGNVGLTASIYELALPVHGETDTAARLARFADRYPDQP